MTWTSTTLSVLDASGTARTILAFTDGANFSLAHPLLDAATGAAVSPANLANQVAANTSLAAIQSAVQSNAVPGVIPLIVGVTATAGRSLAVNCTVAGNVSVTFSDAPSSTYPVSVGLNVFPFAVTKVNTSGTTATATYENWK